jgi:hypothetical protein
MRKILFLLLVFVVCGCAARHVEEIRRIQVVSAEMAAQQRLVDESNKRFEALLKVVQEKTMSDYKTRKDFLDAFGQPIFTKRITGSPAEHELWLYRYCEKFWGSEKVYLYFDKEGNLVRWEHRAAESQ